MASKGEIRRRTLFSRFSSHFAEVCPDHQGLYACPMCFALHDEMSIVGSKPTLNEEHCIPEGLSDNRCVLICTNCNSRAGDGIDAQLHNYVNLIAFKEGSRKAIVHAELAIDENKATVELSRPQGPGHLCIKVIDKASSPSSISRLQEIEPHSRVEFTVRSRPKRFPNERFAKIAMLKSAYLLMFRRYGYRYIAMPLLGAVREQIQSPTKSHVPVNDLVIPGRADNLQDAIYLASTTDGLSCVGVPIRINNLEMHWMVILPKNNKTFDAWSSFRRTSGPTGHDLHLYALSKMQGDQIDMWPPQAL